MLLAETVQDWPGAAIAIAGVAMVASVTIVAVWQALGTWRAKMLGSREAEYRALAERATEAQERTAAALERLHRELAAPAGAEERP